MALRMQVSEQSSSIKDLKEALEESTAAKQVAAQVSLL